MNKTLKIILAVLILAIIGYFAYDKYATRKVDEEKEVIKIGAILPLTGPAGSLGVYYKNGLELKVKELNEKGGFNGKKVKLIIEDSKTSPKDGANAAQKIILDNPLFVFSHLSSVTLAINPILSKKNIPVIAVSASDKLLDYKYAIRNYIKPERLAKFAFDKFSKELDINDFALIYVNDDFGKSVADKFKSECSVNNVRISYEDVFNLTNTDYRNIVSKIKSHNSKAVYVTGYGKPLALFIKQLFEGGYEGKICTGIEITQPEVIDFLGEYANDIYFPNLLFNNNNNLNFIKSYNETFHKEAFSASALAYDGAQIMLNAFEEANYDVNNFIEIMNGPFGFNSLNGDLEIIDREIIYPFTLNKLVNKKITALDGN